MAPQRLPRRKSARGPDRTDSPPLPEAITPDWLKTFRERLRRWHRGEGRALPWRKAGPYRVWVSEIMLQQTTVTAVVPYYERFLAAFPTVEALAAAEEQAVLRLWEGLGYYSRARNLHRTARQLVTEFDGQLPDDAETLQTLPGIGRYTAGAIVSFGYDLPAPIVEANTLRLYTRLLNFEGDPRSTDGQRRLWQFAEAILPRSSPGEFNQALTDLGATVCTVTEPRCETCPVMTLCGAFQSGRQRELPRPAKRPELTDVTECAVVIEQGGRYLLRRCQPGERWAGLWDFPRFPLATSFIPASEGKPRGLPAGLARFAAEEVDRLTGVKSCVTEQFCELRHGVTRYRIRLVCLRGTCSPTQPQMAHPSARWVNLDELTALPLSTTGRKIALKLRSAASARGEESQSE